jgi:hypothetical protein
MAENLLEELVDEQIALMSIDPSSEPHIVIGSNRIISVPEELQKIAVQYDHNVETVTFDCPRYWDGLDMSEMRIYINYKRSDNNVGMSLGKNVVVDEVDTSIMHFNWTITRGVTLVAGALSFSVCIKKPTAAGTEENHWNSEINTQTRIAPGLEYEEQKNPQQVDLISDLINRMEETEFAVEKAGVIISTEQMNALLAQFDSIKEELAKRTETVPFNAVIEVSGWSTGDAPYTNVVSIPGVEEEDSPHVTPVYSSNADVAMLQKDAWNLISDGDAGNDVIVFTCFKETPTVDIPIQVECFRTWKE